MNNTKTVVFRDRESGAIFKQCGWCSVEPISENCAKITASRFRDTERVVLEAAVDPTDDGFGARWYFVEPLSEEDYDKIDSVSYRVDIS